MLKKSALKKIMISTLSLILVSILYLFPNSYKQNSIDEKVTLKEPIKSTIYIPNNDGYVSRTEVISKSNDDEDLVKEIISYLTIDSKKNNYISNFFNPIIPKGTKIIDLEINNKLLKINFSQEFYNLEPGKERKAIEAIVYSLTENSQIDQVMIFVDGKILNKIPNTNESLPPTLDRSMGINITYDLNDFKNTQLITTYYIGKQNNNFYYIPISKLSNNDTEKVEVIIEELKSAPIYQTNLMSFLKSNVKLLDYEILEDQITLSFNNQLFDDISKQNILEEVKYSISLSIKDNYNIKTVIYNVDDTEILKFTLN